MNAEDWRDTGLADAHLDALLRLAFVYESALMAEEAEADAPALPPEAAAQARAPFERARAARESARLRETRAARRRMVRRRAQLALNIAACVVLAAALATPLAVARVESLRGLVRKMFVQDHGLFSTITVELDDENESLPVPDEWEGSFFPYYIPETLHLYHWNYESPMCILDFKSHSGLFLNYQEVPGTAVMNLDTEDSITWYEDINGHSAFISYEPSANNDPYEDVISIVWEADGKLLVVYSNDKDIALKVARGVRKVVR